MDGISARRAWAGLTRHRPCEPPPGQAATRITSTANRNGPPVWLPDGRTIAFFSGAKIYLMNADGSEHRPLTKPFTGGRYNPAMAAPS